MSETCPSKERWQEHLNASLPADQDTVLTEHLDSCANCRKTLETLAGGSDSLLAVARQAGDATDASSPALKEIVAQFQAPSEQTQAEPSGAKDESLTFLTPSEKSGCLGRLGHYEVQAIIGKGGFGIVLKAFDEKLHRIVAIKVLSPAYAAIGSARKRFIREARAAAAVSHDHVVGIYAVEEEQNPPYLVMQCVDGQSLQDKLDRKGSLSLKEILRIGLQSAEGLAAAHKQGLVHRDIKPANILLENGVERVKITDFGLARAVDDASVTQSGTVAGTPMYMSPEQAEGLPIDHRSDLFSLGTVLYAMCTGHPPFRASGTHAVLKRVIDASPRPIREINNEIPYWLEAIIAKLHAKKPEDRFQTAKEVAELLGQHLAHLQQPTQSPRPAPVEPPTKTMMPRRRRMPIAVGLLALLLFVGGTIWAGPTALRYIGNRGEVEVIPESGWVSVIVHKDGDAVTDWFDVGKRPTIKLPPGKYKFPPGFGPGRTLEHWEVTYHGLFSSYTLLQFERDPLFDLARGERVTIRAVMRDEPTLPEPQNPPAAGWVQLFNGKDLTGWKTHPTQPGDWKVENGVLVGRGPKASHLFSARGDFRDFHLRLETKLNDTGESSVFVRCPFGLPFTFGGTGLPGGFDVDFQGDGTSVIAGQLAMLGPKPLLNRVAIPPDTWFTIEVMAKGDRIVVKVNDQTTADYGDTDRKFATGHLALQVYKADTLVHFRKIEIKELPPTFKDDKERLQGQWVAVDLEEGGRNQKEGLNVVQWLVTFTGDRCHFKTVTRVGQKTSLDQDGLFLTDLSTNPKRFRLVMPSDEKQVRQLIGIYEFQGEYLRMCYAGHPGVPVNVGYPTAFATKAGSPLLMVTLKRLPVEEPGWVPLFNGKDRTGWVSQMNNPKEVNPDRAWEVLDNILIARGTPEGYLRTEKAYHRYILEMECQASQPPGPGWAGDLLFHIPVPDPGFGRTTGIRLRIKPGSGGSLTPLGGMTPFALRLVDWRTFKPDWNQLRFESTADRFEIVLNGKSVLKFTEFAGGFPPGYFGIMSAGSTGMRYRNIRIKELPPTPTAPPFVIAGTPRLLKTIDNNSTVLALAFTAEGDTLIAGGDHLTFFDRAKGDVLHQEKLPSPITSPFSLSQDRKTLALVYKEAALVLDLPIRKIPLQAKRGLTFSAALSPDGKTLVYADEKMLWFHDRATGKTEAEGRHGNLMGLKYSPDGRFLLGINAKELMILDAKTRDVVAKEAIGPGFGGGVEISQDSKRFVTTGVSGDKFAFHVFSLPDHELRYTETNVAKPAFSLALSPDGNYLALGLMGGTVQIWDLAQKKSVASLTVAKVLPKALAFSPDGKTLATGSGNFIEVWDLTPQ